MKFENLNQEKFEKIEKNELGMLVGGAGEGWQRSGQSDLNYPVQFSSDLWRATGPGDAYNEVVCVANGDLSPSQALALIAKFDHEWD